MVSPRAPALFIGGLSAAQTSAIRLECRPLLRLKEIIFLAFVSIRIEIFDYNTSNIVILFISLNIFYYCNLLHVTFNNSVGKIMPLHIIMNYHLCIFAFF